MNSASMLWFVFVGITLGCISTHKYQTFNQKLFLVAFSGLLGVIGGGVVYGFTVQVAFQGSATFAGGHAIGYIFRAFHDKYKKTTP